MNGANNSGDDVNLLFYLRIILNRKRLILSVFSIIVTIAIILSVVMPKIYHGEFFLKVRTYDYADVYRTLKIDSYGLRKNIFKQTNNLIADVRMSVFEDTSNCKIHLIVEAKDTSYIRRIADEFISYINNTPYQMEHLDKEKKVLQDQIKECTASVEYINVILKPYAEKTVPEPFGVKQLLDQRAEMESKKAAAEMTLKNLAGTEIIFSEIYSTPVRPSIVSNVLLSAIIGLLAGLFAVVLVEVKGKIRSSET